LRKFELSFFTIFNPNKTLNILKNKPKKLTKAPAHTSGKGHDHSKKEVSKQEKRRQNIELLKKLLPLIKAFVLWFVLVMIVHVPGIKDVFKDLVVGFTTSTTIAMGKIFFLPIHRLGFSSISLDGFPMQIIVECTAYNFYLFAISLVIFSNWKISHKFLNLGIFIVIIFILNNLRFFAMGYIGSQYPAFFETTHDYVWNILFGFMIFGVWAWRDKISNPDFRPKDPQP
jgi:exosortase/archaeosortase family protein